MDCLRGPLGQRCQLHLVTQCKVPQQPNVFVHQGLQPNSAPLLRLFAQADLLVLPTQADSLGLVLMEAAASRPARGRDKSRCTARSGVR